MSAIETQEHAVALRPVTGNSLNEVKALGSVFKASGYFKDVRDEAQAVVKILYGRELGLTPIVAMMGIYIIEGKPSLSANVLAAVIKRSGRYDYRVKESTATRCLIEFREKGEVIGESEFTMEDAKAAGVANKDNWRKYSKAMLFARALSAGARMHCPDVGLCPIYVPEELGASVTEEGDVTELPKSARPVAVTTEDIELGSPATGAAPISKGPEPASNNGGEHVEQAAPAVEYITPDQASTLHIHFKDFLDKSLRKKADSYVESWCKSRGLVDPGGAGSTKFIKATYIRNGAEVSGFTEAKAALEQYALDLNVKMSEAK